MNQVILYRKNALGIGVWKIEFIAKTSESTATIIVSHSVVQGGVWIQHVDTVRTNKSGRTIHEQVKLEMQSRINRQLDKGYKATVEEAMLGSTNQMGLVNPMLAQKVTDVRITQSMMNSAYVQPKYDGHRCLITKQGGEVLAYTRKGKPVHSITHILMDVDRWIQDGDTLDGELYIHGMALQTISSLIKAPQADSVKLRYHWYDMVLDKPFMQRYSVMKDLHANSDCEQIELVPTIKVDRMADVYANFRRFREQGLEGAMLRLSTAGYEDGTRAAQLLKVKQFHDSEVTILGARPSAEGWAILRVRTDEGKDFDISAPGSKPEKTRILHEIDKYLNKRLTIEYASLTNDGIPFHAVAIRIREDL